MRNSTRSTLLYMGTEIERMGDALGAPEETQRDAIRLCGDVLRFGYDYDSVDSVAGACFYLACTRRHDPISLPDVASQARKSKKNIQHLGAKLMDELDIRPRPVEPDTFIEDGVRHFDFDAEQADECLELLERVKNRGIHSGLAPTTVAGAILYAVSQKFRIGLTQRDVADFVSKTTVSIRENYREILRLADDVPVDALPPETVDAAIAHLGTRFEDHPAGYAEEARNLARDADSGPGTSLAGVVGGAYLAVTRKNGLGSTPDEIASTVGVSPQTVQKHSRRFET